MELHFFKLKHAISEILIRSRGGSPTYVQTRYAEDALPLFAVAKGHRNIQGGVFWFHLVAQHQWNYRVGDIQVECPQKTPHAFKLPGLRSGDFDHDARITEHQKLSKSAIDAFDTATEREVLGLELLSLARVFFLQPEMGRQMNSGTFLAEDIGKDI